MDMKGPAPTVNSQWKGSARDPERTREQILSAALQEFSAKGFAGARVDVIARRAAINKRMLYHYFGDKAGLFREVDRKSTRLNSSHSQISYAVFCLKKKKNNQSNQYSKTRRKTTATAPPRRVSPHNSSG